MEKLTKLTNESITIDVFFKLQKYIKKVDMQHYRINGGLIDITFDNGEEFIVFYNSYDDCKADFMKFSRKLRVSAKTKIAA